MLHEWGTQGVPVDCIPNWEWDIIKHTIKCGPHCSVMETENIVLVHKDISITK
jgi:hypothetical protein